MPCNLAHGHGSRRCRTRSFYCSAMPALDHRTTRGHAPFIAARNDRDAYRQLVLNRSRSPPPSRGEDELVLRGQAAKKGQSSVIAVSVAGIHYALQRRGLELKLCVFGATHPGTINHMVEISVSWFQQGLFQEAADLQVKIVDVRREMLGARQIETANAMQNLGIIWGWTGQIHRQRVSSTEYS